MSSELSRYQRQMLLSGVGEAGQGALAGSHALIVGCGALGCASADMLARAGVGELTIVDRDVVEPSNLQRQCLFDESDAAEGAPKAVAAKRRIAAVNSLVRVNALVEDFTHRNALEICAGGAGPVRALIDGTDNFETRYLLNDLGVRLRVPYLYGGVVGSAGMQATFDPGSGDGTGCLRCLFEAAPEPGVMPTCDTVGVLGPAVMMVASLQCADAIRVLTGGRAEAGRRLTSLDLWSGELRRIDLRGARNAQCPCCGAGRTEWLDGLHAGGTTSLCGRDAVQVLPGAPGAAGGAGSRGRGIALAALGERLRAVAQVSVTDYLLRAALRDERPDAGDGATIEITVFRDARAIVRGTRSAQRARSLYAKYIGA